MYELLTIDSVRRLPTLIILTRGPDGLHFPSICPCCPSTKIQDACVRPYLGLVCSQSVGMNLCGRWRFRSLDLIDGFTSGEEGQRCGGVVRSTEALMALVRLRLIGEEHRRDNGIDVTVCLRLTVRRSDGLMVSLLAHW